MLDATMTRAQPGSEHTDAADEAPPVPTSPSDLDQERRTSMAAERTWLAWWRTALGATAGALAVGRFDEDREAGRRQITRSRAPLSVCGPHGRAVPRPSRSREGASGPLAGGDDDGVPPPAGQTPGDGNSQGLVVGLRVSAQCRSAPSGIRTRATTLKGWRPGPLVDGGGGARIPAAGATIRDRPGG